MVQKLIHLFNFNKAAIFQIEGLPMKHWGLPRKLVGVATIDNDPGMAVSIPVFDILFSKDREAEMVSI